MIALIVRVSFIIKMKTSQCQLQHATTILRMSAKAEKLQAISKKN